MLCIIDLFSTSLISPTMTTETKHFTATTAFQSLECSTQSQEGNNISCLYFVHTFYKYFRISIHIHHTKPSAKFCFWRIAKPVFVEWHLGQSGTVINSCTQRSLVTSCTIFWNALNSDIEINSLTLSFSVGLFPLSFQQKMIHLINRSPAHANVSHCSTHCPRGTVHYMNCK